MSIARIRSFAFSGIEAVPVDVQVQISSGLPAFLVVGLPDKARNRLAQGQIGLGELGFAFTGRLFFLLQDG